MNGDVGLAGAKLGDIANGGLAGLKPGDMGLVGLEGLKEGDIGEYCGACLPGS
jgi:hypothetical protein